MKKLILVLAIALIAVPAMAVNVILEQVDSDTLAVKYNSNGTTPETRMRAVALVITAPGATLTLDAGSYVEGESTPTVGQNGYGIYPASISINAEGTVTDDGSPLADAGDPGADLGDVVLEFGSLYDSSITDSAPGTEGTLCTFTVAAASTVTITMVDEDIYRGGLVLENGDATGDIDTSIEFVIASGPEPATNGTPVANVTTATGGLATDLGWTAGAGATSYDVYFGTVNPPPFLANVATTSRDVGAMAQGKLYYASVVAKNASGDAEALNWNFRTDCLKQSGVPVAEWNDWVAWGRPKCWGYSRQCRGDINGTKNMQYVQLLDLNALKSAYGKTDAQLALITNGICADLNHTKNMQRVQLLDLNILKSYYGKSDALTPLCDVNKVNFWTVPADL